MSSHVLVFANLKWAYVNTRTKNIPLFEGASFEAKCDHYRHDYSAAVAGESVADMCVAMMKQAIGASTYDKDAGGGILLRIYRGCRKNRIRRRGRNRRVNGRNKDRPGCKY